jgi:hypothetical protein
MVSVDDEDPPGVRLEPMLRETVKSVAEGDPAAVRLTDPVSPRLEIVTAEEAELPDTILDGLGETAVMVKSGTSVIMTDGAFVREKDPLTPLIVTVYDPEGVKAEVEIVKVSVPVDPGVRSTDDALRAAVSPDAWGETEAARLTVPVKPRLLTLIADVAWPPLTKLPGEAELDTMAKSGVTESVNVKG